MQEGRQRRFGGPSEALGKSGAYSSGLDGLVDYRSPEDMDIKDMSILFFRVSAESCKVTGGVHGQFLEQLGS